MVETDYKGKKVHHLMYWVTGTVTEVQKVQLKYKDVWMLTVKWDTGATTKESINSVRLV